MKKITIMIFMLIFAGTGVAHSEEVSPKLSEGDIKKVQSVSNNLAICGGVYGMMSELNQATGSSNLAANIHETSNGAMIASAYLIYSMGVISEWKNALQYSENIVSSEKLRWAALFEATADASEVVAGISSASIKCNELGDFQAELVQEARLWAYKNQPK